jgi:hypothetical protein
MIRTHVQTRNNRQVTAVLMLLGALAASWILAQWILGATPGRLALGALAFLVLLLMLTAVVNWRLGLYFFFLWLLFEDLARKFLGNNMAIYFGKDILVAICFFSFFVSTWRSKEKQLHSPWLKWLLPFLALGIVHIFNPNSPSIFYGLLGLKLFFFYIPLMFLGYALIRKEEDLHRFLLFHLSLAGAITLLGVIQAIVGLDFLSPQELAPELEALGRLTRVSPLTKQLVPRPTSVFVSDGRFAWYTILMWILGLGAAGFALLRARRGSNFILLNTAIVYTASLMTGSRGTIIYTTMSGLILAGAFLWGSPAVYRQGRRLLKTVRRGIAITAVAVLLTIALFPKEVGARWAFYSETLLPSSPTSELGWRAWEYPVREFVKAFSFPQWPLGYGIGTSALGVQYVERLLGVASTGVMVESGYGTLVVELGIAGLVLWLVWTCALILAAWRVTKSLRGTSYFPIAFAISWFAFFLVFALMYMGMSAYQNFVNNAYFWLLVGVLFRLADLHADGQLAARRQFRASPHAA